MLHTNRIREIDSKQLTCLGGVTSVQSSAWPNQIKSLIKIYAFISRLVSSCSSSLTSIIVLFDRETKTKKCLKLNVANETYYRADTYTMLFIINFNDSELVCFNSSECKHRSSRWSQTTRNFMDQTIDLIHICRKG